MTHILHIDTSPRAERSVSRGISNEFVTAWKEAHPKIHSLTEIWS